MSWKMQTDDVLKNQRVLKKSKNKINTVQVYFDSFDKVF